MRLKRKLVLLVLGVAAIGLAGGRWAATAGAQELDEEEARRLAPAESSARPGAAPRRDVAPRIDLGEIERFRAVRRSLSPEERGGDELRLRALEGFLDLDSEEEILYSPGRTQIFYRNFFLEADRVILDNRLNEVQAEGNVILRIQTDDFGEDEIFADSMRYNFDEGDARAPPPFQQVSAEESLYRDTEITTCEFKKPHFHVKAKEIIIFAHDRLFLRGATFYVGDLPVFYLPFFSRSMREASPWFVKFGAGSRTGARIRIGYQYEHESLEPRFDDEDTLETRSRGQAQVFADYLSKRGFGGGVRYKYEFDYQRHTGELEAYGLRDRDRKVGEATADIDPDEDKEGTRWQLVWKHRSNLLPGRSPAGDDSYVQYPDLYLTVDIDTLSDPEVYLDILDQFVDGEFERERLIERRGRAGITYLQEAYVARIMVEFKDRIGIDRFGNFSDAADNNLDFDFDPGAVLKDSGANSIARSRWGRVTERLPEITLATRYLPIRNWPLYLLSEVRAYNNLDKGINIVDDKDDARVRGVEIYNQLMWQYRLSQRFTLLSKLGLGLGYASRSNNDLGINAEDLASVDPATAGALLGADLRYLRGIGSGPFYRESESLVGHRPGLIFVDEDTFLVGDEEFSLDDIKNFYIWTDAEVRLNARFSDALTGFLRWRFRETTDDFIGDFYARIGDVTSREDLFDYRLREHWIEGNLTYQLLHPALVLYANAGANLKSNSDLFPNEDLGYWNVGTRWSNRRRTLTASASFGRFEKQFFHPGDPRAGEQTFTFFDGRVDYSPIHGRWYTRLRFNTREVSGETAEFDDDGDFSFFSEEDSRTRVTWIYGRELGPKWNAEVRLRWDDRVEGLREISWLLERDMHDALAVVRVRSRRDIFRADNRKDNPTELDVSFGLKLKLPDQEVAFGADEISTLRRRQRQPVVAY